MKKYRHAIDSAGSVLNKSPDNKYFNTALNGAYTHVYKQKYVEIYEKVIKYLKQKGDIHDNNEVVLEHEIIYEYYRMGDYEIVLGLCNNKNYDNKSRLKLSHSFVRIESMRNELLKAVERD